MRRPPETEHHGAGPLQQGRPAAPSQANRKAQVESRAAAQEVIRNMKPLLSILLLLAATLAFGCSARETGVSGGYTDEPQEVQLRILAINDFHGNISTTSDAFGGVGRADYLAANIAAARAGAENSVFVSAGDLIGGSPLISALFHDEPTIEAMNLMGLDFNGVGNHEFDEGPVELLRMQQGGHRPEADGMDGEPFQGADFQFLAANVIDDRTGSTIFPSYAVRDFQGIKVAFIGLTLEGTPLNRRPQRSHGAVLP